MERKEYHTDWNDIIRPAILKRDQYKCSDCGLKHKSRVYKTSHGQYQLCDEFVEAWARGCGKKVFTVFLNVAHLDQDKTNNEYSNLLSKCPRCHSLFDAPAKALKRLTVLKSEVNITGSTQKTEPLFNAVKVAAVRLIVRHSTNVNISRNEAIEIIRIVSNL